MTIHAVIYSKPNCVKCKMTGERLQEVMRVKHEHLFDGNDEWSTKKIEKFKEQGYGSFPVVRIYDDESGTRLDDWCDFRPDLIHKYVNMATKGIEKPIKKRFVVSASSHINYDVMAESFEEAEEIFKANKRGDGVSWNINEISEVE